MLESFLNDCGNSDLINGEKTMRYFLDDNEDNSSISQRKIREQDLSAEQECNELKGLIEELARKAGLKRIELEHQALNCTGEVSSQIELQITENDDYFAGDSQGAFADFFESLFNLFEVDVDPKVYKMLKEKKDKNLLLSIMQFLRDKLKELVKKIFKKDLSWDKRLDKEIKELQEKLVRGGLSPEEEMAILQRLEALQNLKLKLQTFLVGSIITIVAEIFAIDLAAVVEQSAVTEKEEDKKVEKTASKEKEEVEIKVDEKKELQAAKPVFLFDSAYKIPRPITLDKKERSLFPKSVEKLIDSSPKFVKGSEVEKVSKEKKEEKIEKPKVAVCPPAPEKRIKQKPMMMKKPSNRFENTSRRDRKDDNSNVQKVKHDPLGNAELSTRFTDSVEVENPASMSKGR